MAEGKEKKNLLWRWSKNPSGLTSCLFSSYDGKDTGVDVGSDDVSRHVKVELDEFSLPGGGGGSISDRNPEEN